MSLQEEREALQLEKQTYIERMQKLEERRDKVKPQLYEKLRGEIDEKVVDVDTRLAEVERQILEEQQAAAAAAMHEREGARREAILEKYADELQSLQDDWQKEQNARRKELQGHANNLHHQRDELEGKLPKIKEETEELELRKEIGEFEDNQEEYEAEVARVKYEQEKVEADMSAVDHEISQVSDRLDELDNTEMPDFSEQVIENHREEMEAPEPEPEPEPEEVYEPEAEEEIYEPEESEFVEETVVAEEEISADEVAADEEVVTEVETIYEDEAEEAFFSSGNKGLITATINPCLIERLETGQERVHELVLGGAKTLIGSSEICDVYLPYPVIDAKHAWIKVDRKAQYLIKDLGSKTGTYINGKKIKKAYLQNGDQVRFGEIKLTVKLI